MAKRSINDKLKDIEHMIPYKFHFDFGFHTTIKETYQHKSHDDDFDQDKDYKIEEYLTYDYIESAATLENSRNGMTDGYMMWDEFPLQIFPTLELIVKYSHIIFEDERKYIVGKGNTEITDLISLFRFLQTTKNYAIFNNLLNVMLIFIIDYTIEFLNEKNEKNVKSINGHYLDLNINEHYRKIYRVKPENNAVILVNSFIYKIEKKNVDYYPIAFNEKIKTYLASNWDKCFDEILSHFQKKSGSQKPSSHSPDKESDLTIKACKSLLEKSGYNVGKKSSSQSPDKETKISIKTGKTLLERLEYNMGLNQKIFMSLQYQFIMDNIDNFPALNLNFQSKKEIYTSDKHMNEILDVFEATYYGKTSYGLKKIKNGEIPIYIKIYSDNNKLYITYQIGDRYKSDPVIPLKMMLLNQLILFSNKQVLKELYILAKKGADWLPPKGSSSSSIGSYGSPPTDLPSLQLKQKSNTSLEYKYIMDHIDDFPSLATEHNMKLINTSNKYMNQIKGVFEATNYAKSSYENIEDSKIPIYIYIYSKENKLYITYQIGDRYKRDPVIPLNIMELNQEILFKNEHILKELYELIKGVIEQPNGGKAKKKK